MTSTIPMLYNLSPASYAILSASKLFNFRFKRSAQHQPQQVADSRDRSPQYQRLQAALPDVEADHCRLRDPQAEQLHNSDADHCDRLLVVGANDPVADDVGDGRKGAQDHEGDQRNHSALECQGVVNNHKPQLLKHHDVDEGLLVGGDEVRNPIGVVDGESLGEIDVDDFLFLLVDQVLDLVHFAGLFRLDVLDLRSGGEVVAEAHPDAVADDGRDAEGHDFLGGFVGGDAGEDDDEGVDGAVESAVDEGLEDVPGVDVVFLVAVVRLFAVDKGFVDIALRLLHDLNQWSESLKQFIATILSQGKAAWNQYIQHLAQPLCYTFTGCQLLLSPGSPSSKLYLPRRHLSLSLNLFFDFAGPSSCLTSFLACSRLEKKNSCSISTEVSYLVALMVFLNSMISRCS